MQFRIPGCGIDEVNFYDLDLANKVKNLYGTSRF